MAAKNESKKVSHNSSSDNITENEVQRKRGRPKSKNPQKKAKAAKAVANKTKVIDGKLMRRAVGVPRKVLTGKPGRPRKEYVWVEVAAT